MLTKHENMLSPMVIYQNQGFGKQFKNAGKSGAKLALVYGGDELAAGKVKIRNLESGEEELADRNNLLKSVQQALA